MSRKHSIASVRVEQGKERNVMKRKNRGQEGEVGRDGKQ
jgi:hypothetical protein